MLEVIFASWDGVPLVRWHEVHWIIAYEAEAFVYGALSCDHSDKSSLSHLIHEDQVSITWNCWIELDWHGAGRLQS